MKKYAVITGASSGIGRKFAEKLAKEGYSLALVARRETKLLEIAQSLETECEIITADLARDEECFRVFELVKDKKIDIFINNAGFGECGKFVEIDMQKELRMLQVNCKAVHIFAKLIIQKMQEDNGGYLLNVASAAGLMPAGPYMASYYATKAYVASLTQGIAEELREAGSRVYVGCLCPGPVETEFSEVAGVEFALKGISADFCVEYALKQMKKRKVVIIPSLPMRTAMATGRFLPVPLYVRIAAHQQRKKFQYKD